MPPRSYLPARVPTYRPVMPKTSQRDLGLLTRVVSPAIQPSPITPVASSQFAFLRLSFSTLPPRAYPSLSPLFALAQLSNARESQALSKKSRLSRVDHSPALEIIRSSEVDQLPFVTTSNSTRETRERRLEKEKAWREFKGGREALHRRRDRGRAWGGEAVSEWGVGDATRAGAEAAAEARAEGEVGTAAKTDVSFKTARPFSSIPSNAPSHAQSRTNTHALAVGKAVLASHAARHARLTRALAIGQRFHAREAEVWAAERRTYERERRSGSLIVLASALLATGAIAWRWGEVRSVQQESEPPLDQWRKKWEMRETEAARAAVDSQTNAGAASRGVGGELLLAADRAADDMTTILYTCHEDGCAQRMFGSDEEFMHHYRAIHPALVEHLYGNPNIKESAKGKSWFWA